MTTVLPSGSGKTVLALHVAEALCAPLAVVLVPSIDLVSQSYRDWERWRAAPGALDGWRHASRGWARTDGCSCEKTNRLAAVRH